MNLKIHVSQMDCNIITNRDSTDKMWNMLSYAISSFSSVAQSCLTLCDPKNCSTPGLPVHHQLPEFTQILVHGVGDAIQPSHPLSSPSPPAFNPSQHQGLFKCHQCFLLLQLDHTCICSLCRPNW